MDLYNATDDRFKSMEKGKMSSMEHRKYLRQEKAKGDKKQAVLIGEGISPNPHHFAVKTDVFMPVDKKVTCPFCLGLQPFNLFLTSTKKGISRSIAKCPLCHQGFKLETLMKMSKWTAKEYAEWVQPYSHSGFWQKINFSVWRNRLQLMGWTDDFWNRYNELKGSDTNESYEDHMKRAQEEWQKQAQENDLTT